MTWEDGNNWVNRWEKSKTHTALLVMIFIYNPVFFLLYFIPYNNIWRDPVVVVSGSPKASSIIGLRENKNKIKTCAYRGCRSVFFVKMPQTEFCSLFSNWTCYFSCLPCWWIAGLLGLLLLFKSHQRHPAERELFWGNHIKCIVRILPWKKTRENNAEAAHGTAHNLVNKLFIS